MQTVPVNTEVAIVPSEAAQQPETLGVHLWSLLDAWIGNVYNARSITFASYALEGQLSYQWQLPMGGRLNACMVVAGG